MKIDLLICTFNQAELLNQTLKALGTLRGPPRVTWSVTVVNNNCTDHTEQVVAAHQKLPGAIPELNMVHEPSQGLAAARLRGVKSTDGQIIAMVDDDCLLDEDWLCELAAFVEAHPRAGVIGSRVKLRYLGRPTGVAMRHERALAAVDWSSENAQVHPTDQGFLVGAGLCMRRSALEASGWMQHQILSDRKGLSLSSGGDTEIVYRIRNAGYEAWFVPTMRLTHLIPEHRCRLDYLERLYTSLGESSPLLKEIRQGAPMSPQAIEKGLRLAGKRASHATVRLAIYRCLLMRSAWEDWRLKRARYRGRAAGWRLLRDRCQARAPQSSDTESRLPEMPPPAGSPPALT